MIRWLNAQELEPAVRLMQAAKMGCSWYGYGRMDGLILVDVDYATGELRGYVRFDLGRPETHVRQLVVAPAHQGDGLVAKGLLAKLIQVAEAHGAQGIEGFLREDQTVLLEQIERVGAYVDRGVRVRWPLTPTANAKAKEWREALRA